MDTTVNQEITLTEAVALTTAFRSANPGANLAEAFFTPIIQKILAQPGCVGVRVYNGLSGTTQSSVLVGVDADGNDIVDGVLGDRSIRPVGRPNALNS